MSGPNGLYHLRLPLVVVVFGALSACGGSVIGPAGSHGHGAAAASETCEPGSGAVHTGHTMTGSSFRQENLRCAVFDTAQLNQPDFAGADLSRASLRDTRLSGPDFSGAKLVDADFTGAQVSNPNFAGADLRGADLSTAAISSPNWTDATCPDGQRADAAGCDGHLRPVDAR